MAALVSLRSRQDFTRLRQSGRRTKPSPWMIIYRKRNDLGKVRLGCTIPRYIGTAVTRNRLRRWCKEYFRNWAKKVQQDKAVDISIVFLRTDAKLIKAMSHKDLNEVLDRDFA